jgi:RNA polymerase sigma factor (TIGR02999 family)
VDNARRKKSLKRGGSQQRVDLEDTSIACTDASTADRLLALDEALARLSKEDPVKANLVKLRYFTGLTMEQASEMLGISPTTAKRYWSYARAWLLREME